MIEALRSVLKQATQGLHSEPAGDAAERLAEEQALLASKAEEIAERAEALMATAQERRNRGDRIGASIYLAEAITLLRTANDLQRLAYALRHAAEVRSELREYAVAGAHIQEAIRLYRAFDPAVPLELANALRVQGLNDERQARASWTEAEQLYADEGIEAGVAECKAHLDALKHNASSMEGQE